ncbi:MAG: response regulator [Ignavibacteriales bacterium]|nr:response regulator [Ignavibacteriales bacterium]
MDKRKETILIAEDDEMMRIAAQKLLELEGYHVISMPDGREALKAFMENVGRIHLIFSDLEMPHLNGIQLTRKIKAVDPSVEIVLTSGNLHAGLRQELQEAGVQHFIPKPYRPEDLFDMIQRICKEKS